MISHHLVSNVVNGRVCHFHLPFYDYFRCRDFVNQFLEGETKIYRYHTSQISLRKNEWETIYVGMTVKSSLGEKSTFFLHFNMGVTEQEIMNAFVGKTVNGFLVSEVDIFNFTPRVKVRN